MILDDNETHAIHLYLLKKRDSNVVISTKMYLNECYNLCYYIFEYLINEYIILFELLAQKQQILNATGWSQIQVPT